ncbi:phage minor head protein [Rummeliibacillus pycnus]|uniref:phage minor head protein n=1 Tax=Rummeliibacillus pycnus TaxID=101070 RepID=UPI0037CC0D4A
MNQQEIKQEIEKLIQKVESDIELVFSLRLQNILDELNKMYIKFVKSDETSYTDLNKYNRLSKELDNIATELSEDYKSIVSMIAEMNETIYVENYLKTAYLFEVFASTEMGFAPPAKSLVQISLRNAIKYLTLPLVLERHRNEIVHRLNIEISQSLIAGEGYWKMAKRIENAVNFSKKKARTVARTEGGRALSLSDEQVYKQASKYATVTKVWLSALDNDVRNAHRKLDGEKADKNGYFHFKGMKAKGPHQWYVAKMDINCRCVVIYLVNGMLPELRRGRDYRDANYQQKLADRIDKYMEDGLTYAKALKKAQKEVKPPNVVVPVQTYEEWEKKFVA